MSFTRSATSSFLRVRVVAGFASVAGGLIAGILFLTALFSHNHLIGRAGVVALASSLLGIGVTRGCQAYILVETGRWMTLDGRPTSRSEQPARFVTWATLLGLFAAIPSAAAAFLIWVAIFAIH